MKTAACLAACLIVMAAPAAGCGYCVEDKVAAAYDHAVVTKALAQGHEVVYLSLEFTQPVNDDTAIAIRKAVEHIAFVDRGSVRVAIDAGGLSLAFDPKRAPAGAMLASLDRAVAPFGVRTTLLRFGKS